MTCHRALPNPFTASWGVYSGGDRYDPARFSRATSRPPGTPEMAVTNDMLDEAAFFRAIGQPGRHNPDFLKGAK